MFKHPSRVAIESGAIDENFSKLFAMDVVIKAPMLTKPVRGVRDVLNIVRHAARLAGPTEYTLEIRDPKQTILLWKGHAGGFTLEAATILVDGEDGLIREIRVLMRPWPIVTILRDAMYRELSATIPQDYRELQPKAADSGGTSPVRAYRPEANRARSRHDAAQPDAGEIRSGQSGG
jgi:hypothetical protein